MTVKSNMDAAVVDLKAELDSMSFLDPGAKTDVDQELVDQIQADMDALVASYGADFSTSDDGGPREPTAFEMAHWLFDPLLPSDHRLTITLYPTSTDEAVVFTTDVPFPWR